MSKRDPLQVDPLFRIKIIDLQNKLSEKSIRELTRKIATDKNIFDEIERLLIGKVKRADIFIKIDKRRAMP